MTVRSGLALPLLLQQLHQRIFVSILDTAKSAVPESGVFSLQLAGIRLHKEQHGLVFAKNLLAGG
jgi:hypothetical protein